MIDLFWNPTKYDEAILEAAKYVTEEPRDQKQINFVIRRICQCLKLEDSFQVSLDIFEKMGGWEGF